MATMTDIIEKFIKDLMEEDNSIQIQRNELANLFSCAPSHSLLNVINKIMELGISLEKCIEKVTEYPTKIFDLHGNKGRIKI
ncbi:CtsR family transcriptional regulator, partial [Clostridioides difficile]